MRLRGIHYDVGTQTIEGSSTRPTLTTNEIERDLADIAHGLHANVVRITGDDIARLAAASTVAVRYGLEVWLSPMIPNADPATTLARIADLFVTAESSDIDGVFIYTYIMPSYPSSRESAKDLDTASYALVRSWPDGRTEPKAAYHTVAHIYGRCS